MSDTGCDFEMHLVLVVAAREAVGTGFFWSEHTLSGSGAHVFSWLQFCPVRSFRDARTRAADP